MPDLKVSALTTIPAVDRAADLLYVVDTSGGTSNKATPNQLLGITGAPVGDTDTATLTNKTLTAPNISSPVLSGTVSGTYTLGGTPTFPAAVVTLTGSQTLTNKVLTSPTINTATIANPTLTVDTVNEFTVGAGITLDGVLLKDGKMNGSYLTDSTVGNSQLISGVPVQVVCTGFNAVATGTVITPFDDTIPQNTEGNEFMTQAITPKSATNILVIEVSIMYSHSAANSQSTVAVFQDSTANAMAANNKFSSVATSTEVVGIMCSMVAGTTGSTTFRVRAGSNAAGTMTFNGQGGARLFGAITKSFIKITEYKA